MWLYDVLKISSRSGSGLKNIFSSEGCSSYFAKLGRGVCCCWESLLADSDWVILAELLRLLLLLLVAEDGEEMAGPEDPWKPPGPHTVAET